MSLNALKAAAMLENKFAREIWATDLKKQAAKVHPQVSQVVQIVVAEVAAATGILTTEITGKARQQPLVRARHFAWFKLMELGLSANEIAGAFQTDHSTVSKGAEKIRAVLEPQKRGAQA